VTDIVSREIIAEHYARSPWPRALRCALNGERAAPRRKRPDNGVATMGRGQWLTAEHAGSAAAQPSAASAGYARREVTRNA